MRIENIFLYLKSGYKKLRIASYKNSTEWFPETDNNKDAFCELIFQI